MVAFRSKTIAEGAAAVPTKIEKDVVTGTNTTGHEWDGLKELNTPLPKWWLYVLYATIAWSAVWFVLYPSVPGVTGYFHGVLGYSQRSAVNTEVRAIEAQRADTMDKIKALSFAEIRKDPQLMAAAETAGRIAFANNCQPCHGAGGGGQPGYPALAAGGWIWGGSLDAIEQTIAYGIRSGDDKARDSQMLRFGADGILKPDEIQNVADYVMTLYGKPTDRDVSAGRKLFADNCAVCHGEAGQGDREKGAPRLASRVHLYGDSRDVVVAQISVPRMSVMPAWHTRLDEATIKSLALYVHSLGGGE
jgi:cytochrome c oxidase cbb3-type subunit III